MSWFDEQIRQRKLSDQEIFEESFFHVADAVLNSRVAAAMRDERIVARDAVGEILKYYHKKPPEVPDTLTDPEAQTEYMLRPYGIMRRNVALEEGWYRDAFGPMLGVMKDSGTPVALLPAGLTGYTWLDRASGQRRPVNRETAKLFERDAVCFYLPLPQRTLRVRDLLLYLRDCLRPGDLLLYAGAALALTLVNFLFPLLIRLLTGDVARSGSVRLLAAVAVFLVCTVISSQLLGAVRELLLSRIRTKMDLNVQAAGMMRILSLPAGFFRRFSSGEIAARAAALNNLCGVILNTVLSTGLMSVFSLLYVGQIFSFAPALVAPALCIIAANIIVSFLTVKLQTRITEEHMEHAAKESGLSYALISGVQKIRLAGAEKRAFARWATHFAEGARLVYNPPAFLKLNSVVNLAIQLGGTVVLYYLAVSSGMGTADYMAFNASYGMVMGAFTSLAGIAMTAAQIKPILEMARPILETEPESAENKAVVTRLGGRIDLSHVSFRYAPEAPWVVDGMSLSIRPGEYVALVGATGCGKSTLLRLLLGFEKPERGAIFYDGKDLSRLDKRSLRRLIGVVGQNDRLMQGSIYENIAVSAPDLTLQGAWEAAELAGIAQDIRDMPMGMQTVISEGQGGISGGQRQRLLIARAVAARPRILMFDEATSALDNKTQKRVSDALDGLNCTRVVIAHRLSTIRHCSRILLLDKGKIAEEGTYEELMERHGAFAALVERQTL